MTRHVATLAGGTISCACGWTSGRYGDNMTLIEDYVKHESEEER